LYAYAVGAAGNYVFLNLACLAVPIVFVLLFVWMPEAPQYLLSKDKSAGATKSLQWLRGKAHNVHQELHELQQLKVSDQPSTTSTLFQFRCSKHCLYKFQFHNLLFFILFPALPPA
jgi:hypothetical protein